MKSAKSVKLAGQAGVGEHSSAGGWLLALGIILIAANLRAPITSVGPLIGDIRESLGISGAVAGMITTLPLLAFAFLSPTAAGLARRFGTARVLLLSVILLLAGVVIRSAAGTELLLLGTVILGMAIAVCNVLMPSLIKAGYPERIGMMIGIYTVAMNLSGAVASGVSVPLAAGAGLGWKGALGIWALLAVLAIACWLPQVQAGSKPVQSSGDRKVSDTPRVNVWKSKLAWQIALYMGCQSMLFYVIITWIPDMLETFGMTPEAAGWTLSAMQLVVLPVSFLVPVLAGRMRSQIKLLVVIVAFFLIGILGLLLGGGRLTLLWTLLVGLGAGSSFSLAMMFYGLRSRSAHTAAELSGMSQAVGYLLAAIGPALLGYLHDATGSWTVPLIIMLADSLLVLVFGIGASRDRYIEDEALAKHSA
ncbi:MFS transporter, CP family, cyanate transporter [Paenibacillus sp. UNCCL117]|uniref:CynX/NimT family MFS transporter n=1 Tax=unclassified Paenibacillus TaxID=185978 RepID=UPI00088F4589|nr:MULTISPECIES: MFS transporter [unclassified Paenibacillus]SDE62380.1 MFS transporter, CP family, cyanate transporter [Paenibacillus sp. cl123]SFW69934.1 MFS transporter, CP family, cyanate transporter [Paenibacillus sp. UNCCL117]